MLLADSKKMGKKSRNKCCPSTIHCFWGDNYQSVLKRNKSSYFTKKESLFISVWEPNQALVSNDDDSTVAPGLRQECSFCMPIMWKR